jgi:multimeric flavodoxin WrbA
MNITVIFGSQRLNGRSHEIENDIKSLNINHHFDFIRMAEMNIQGCIACEKCSDTGSCILSKNENDDFNKILQTCITNDILLIITPIYSPYPSRLTAFMERLLSISFFPYMKNEAVKPLLTKPTGIFCYGSAKIEDDKQLKILFQKCLMNKYSFYEVDYDYINNDKEPNKNYKNVNEYVIKTIKSIET